MRVTSSDLLGALRQHKILEPAQLQELERKSQGKDIDPQTLAGMLIKIGWLTPYQVNQLLHGRGRQLLLGSYILLDRLGEGAMGAVYKARNWKLGTIVALKLIRKERLAHPLAIKRFQREIQAAAQLNHPNIVRALDADEVDGTHFMTMEHIEGTDLSKLVKKHGPLPVDQACDFIRQAALGLQHAHEKRMIHRDIKPHNLLVQRARSGHGIVKILDLGLARVAHPDSDGATNDESNTLTQEGTILGTPDYIAPEQAMGSQVDIRGDLYALGCTFYFLLTGQPPFSGGTLGEKLFKHQLEKPAPVQKLRPVVPSRVTAIVNKLLAKKADQRYQTPADLVKALATVDSGTFKGRLRSKAMVAAGGGILLLLVALFWAISGEAENETANTKQNIESPDQIAGLVAYWKLDEASGSEAHDSSGHGCHGRLEGRPVWTAGKVGGSLRFGGRKSPDLVRASNIGVNTDRGGQNTVALWMRWHDEMSPSMPFGWNAGYGLLLSKGFIGVNTYDNNVLGVSSKGLAHRWVHVAVIFPNGLPTPVNTKLFLNGVEQPIQERLEATRSPRFATSNVFLSGWGARPRLRFAGALDQVRIYNRPLSLEEIKAVMAGKP